jgi:hypothetical protein
MPHQPAITFSISIQHPINRAGGRTSNVMLKTRMPVGQKLMAACGLLAIPVLYIPFRLIAQEFNIVTIATLDTAGNMNSSDDFAYPLSILIWPTYAVLCGCLAPYMAKRLGSSWFFAVFVMIAAFVLTSMIPMIDESLGIPGGGLNGFVSWPNNHNGMTTPKLSAILCLVLFWIGASISVILGSIRYKIGKRTV